MSLKRGTSLNYDKPTTRWKNPSPNTLNCCLRNAALKTFPGPPHRREQIPDPKRLSQKVVKLQTFPARTALRRHSRSHRYDFPGVPLLTRSTRKQTPIHPTRQTEINQHNIWL